MLTFLLLLFTRWTHEVKKVMLISEDSDDCDTISKAARRRAVRRLLPSYLHDVWCTSSALKSLMSKSVTLISLIIWYRLMVGVGICMAGWLSPVSPKIGVRVPKWASKRTSILICSLQLFSYPQTVFKATFANVGTALHYDMVPCQNTWNLCLACIIVKTVPPLKLATCTASSCYIILAWPLKSLPSVEFVAGSSRAIKIK